MEPNNLEALDVQGSRSGGSMDVMEAIYTRQSVGKVLPDKPVPRELIVELLSAAVQAPNHHKVRPWRFIVVQGDACRRLGDAFAVAARLRDPEIKGEALEAERLKPMRAPVVIAVGVDLPSGPKVVEIENVCAAAAAVENLLLAAHSQGLAAMWRTGAAAFANEVKEFLGLLPEQHLIGFIYIGYPEASRLPPVRPGFADRVVWME